MIELSATELAARLGVSKPRISQYISEGKLDGCFVGDGKRRRFDLAKVSEALGRRLDPGQMLGNGSDTRRALKDLDVSATADAVRPATSPRRDAPLPPDEPDRYELARIENAEQDARRKRRDNERDEGRWVLAEEVQRNTARAMAQEIAQFESVLRDGARSVADTLGVDFRAVRKLLLDQWRAYRGTRAEDLEATSSEAEMSEIEEASSV